MLRALVLVGAVLLLAGGAAAGWFGGRELDEAETVTETTTSTTTETAQSETAFRRPSRRRAPSCSQRPKPVTTRSCASSSRRRDSSTRSAARSKVARSRTGRSSSARRSSDPSRTSPLSCECRTRCPAGSRLAVRLRHRRGRRDHRARARAAAAGAARHALRARTGYLGWRAASSRTAPGSSSRPATEWCARSNSLARFRSREDLKASAVAAATSASRSRRGSSRWPASAGR